MTTPVVTSPILALRAAIRAACLADATLAGLMGGAVRLYDEPPPGDRPIYALFGDCKARDASTSSDRGHDQDAALVVWARHGSAAGAHAAAARIADLLQDAALQLEGHRLVLLDVVAIEADRDEETNLARATLRLHAITEVDS